MANTVLTYEYNSASMTYSVTGATIGDNGVLIIPETYNDNTNGEHPVVRIKGNAFKDHQTLTSVTIPNSVTRIGDAAFYGCSGLTSVTIPDSVINIGNEAFYNCSSLTSVTIGDSVTSILSYVFYGCTSLTSIIIPNSVKSIGNRAFAYCSALTNVTIGNSVTSIGYYAFAYCSALTSVAIPDNVTNIDMGIFYRCTSLTNATISNSITSIGHYTFDGCSSLTSIVIPDTATSIGIQAFYNCSSLTSVTIPDSVTSIEGSAFEKCSNLTSATIGNSVITIGGRAFYDCSRLTSATIGNSVTTIGNYAFYDCDDLTSITIGNSITSIGSYAFDGCNLKNIYFTGSKEVWENYKSQSTALASNLIKLYNEIHDCDFLAFTFNGYHSLLDLNITRTSDGDRYNHDLTPQIKDMTAENTGGDGMYYFKTNYPSRQFNISFAFDSLTERQIRKLKQVFSVKELCDLIFDEEPYKVWTAKVTGTPTIKYIPFDDRDGQRVYRGEGSVQFTAYWPFAHTPNTDTKISKKFRASGTFEKNGLLFNEYDEWLYPTKNQWKLASGLKKTGTVGAGENYGDLVATFILSKSTETNKDSVLKVGDLEITLQDKVYKLKWDSKTGIVSGTDSDGEENTRKPVPFSGNSLGGIPVGESVVWGLKENTTPVSYSTTNCTLTYNYWYY